MPGYIKNPGSSSNIKFQLNQLIPPKTHTPILYKEKEQPIQTDTSKQLSEDKVKQVQNIVGTLL